MTLFETSVLAFAVLLSVTANPMQAADPSAILMVHRALEAQGGEHKLRALHSVQSEATGYRNELEQSERPEGPYITEFDRVSEVVDFDGHRYGFRTEAFVPPEDRSASGFVVDGDVAMSIRGGANGPGSTQQVQIAHERIALSPAHLLLTALDAPDLHFEQSTTLQSTPQSVLAFTLDGAAVHIYLNAYTHLPTAVDYSGPSARGDYWRFLGDVIQRTYYSMWWLAKGGIRFPLQSNTETNGLPDRMMTISKLQIDDALQKDVLTIPEDVRARFKPGRSASTLDSVPLGAPNQPAQELAAGIVLIPGAWNITLIRQDDGVVILEAPISSGYSEKVIAEAKRRFPDKPIKAVISTSDSWPHLAGIRQYVAEGIPIYALDLNRPILDRIIAMPYTSRPDEQQRAPHMPAFHWVHDAVSLGTGPNRLQIFPLRGETSERQLMVYFPERHLLYGSDSFQKFPDGSYYYPQTVSELTQAVEREQLQPSKFFMMHLGPAPWSDLQKFLKPEALTDSPNGSSQ